MQEGASRAGAMELAGHGFGLAKKGPAFTSVGKKALRLSIILPAKNEAEGLRIILPRIKNVLPEAEVIVVDDGSTDATSAVALECGASVICSPYPMGNGASIKRGALAAKGDCLLYTSPSPRD